MDEDVLQLLALLLEEGFDPAQPLNDSLVGCRRRLDARSGNVLEMRDDRRINRMTNGSATNQRVEFGRVGIWASEEMREPRKSGRGCSQGLGDLGLEKPYGALPRGLDMGVACGQWLGVKGRR